MDADEGHVHCALRRADGSIVCDTRIPVSRIVGGLVDHDDSIRRVLQGMRLLFPPLGDGQDWTARTLGGATAEEPVRETDDDSLPLPFVDPAPEILSPRHRRPSCSPPRTRARH